MDKFHILLGMPGPNIRFTTAQSCFFCAGKGHQVDVVGADNASWDNMNLLWCQALNAARHEGVTHYAQIHSDITPDLNQDWLNVMLEEMEEFDADFISAVVPIKDGRGLTSSGIADKTNPWNPHRRFTMHELYAMPETFTAEDIGYAGWPLNHNSGLIVADLRRPVFFRTKPDGELAIWFEFRKRVWLDTEKNMVRLDGESEDWNMSRRLWEQGAKTCITRKVLLKHWGQTGYPSGYPWGQLTEDDACKRYWEDGFLDPLVEKIET